MKRFRIKGIFIPLYILVLSLIVLWTIEIIGGYLIHPFFQFLLIYTFYITPIFFLIWVFIYLFYDFYKIYKKKNGNVK